MKRIPAALIVAVLAVGALFALPAAAQQYDGVLLDVKVGTEDTYAGGYLPGQPIPVQIGMICPGNSETNPPCGETAEWYIWAENSTTGEVIRHLDGATGRWLTGALQPSYVRPLSDRPLGPTAGTLTLPDGYWRVRFAVDTEINGVRDENGDFYWEDRYYDWLYYQYIYLEVGVDPGFYADFNLGTAGGWVPDTAGTWRVVGGRYRMTANAPMRVFSSRFNRGFRNFSYRADVRLVSGDADSLYRGMGLLFRSGSTYANGYVFHINARGYYVIFKRVAGRTYFMTRGWTFSPAIVRGKGYWNRLEVVAGGDVYDPAMLEFWINGVKVKQLRDLSFVSGRAGLKAFGDASSGDRVEFDNAILREFGF